MTPAERKAHEAVVRESASPALPGPMVSVPRERIEALLEYWNGNRNDSAMFDALEHIEGELSAMLAAGSAK